MFPSVVPANAGAALGRVLRLTAAAGHGAPIAAGPLSNEIARRPAVASAMAWAAFSTKIAAGLAGSRVRYNRRALNLHRAARQVAAEGWPEDLTELPGVGRYTADAVRRFAFDDPVLPVDTNVRRVLERTGAEFGAECAHALMDLGATVCLARIPRCEACPLARRCPSRGRRFAPQRKQSRFEGSFRQRRARTLRLIAERPRRLGQLDRDVVKALADDGLVEIGGGAARLPS